jgi:hypothetical protein
MPSSWVALREEVEEWLDEPRKRKNAQRRKSRRAGGWESWSGRVPGMSNCLLLGLDLQTALG